MKALLFTTLAALVLMICQPCTASMSSTHYMVSTSVISGGGAPMVSENFQANGTIGQPSPVGTAAASKYELLSGFWQTLIRLGSPWDFEPDGDVDGRDLEAFIGGMAPGGFSEDQLQDFAGQFGSNGLPY